MKNKFLSAFLSVSMLLSVFTVFASTSSAKETDAAPKATEESTSYIDLYVKDGLAALFDGYSLKASSEILSSFAPLDLYGEEGYEDYIDPSSYTANFDFYGASSKRMKWTAANGYLSLSSSGLAAAKGQINDTALNLNGLGAQLGYVFSVQEVFLMDGPLNDTAASSNGNIVEYVPKYSADGKTVENFENLGGQMAWQLGAYGPYDSNIAHFAKQTDHGILDSYMAMVYTGSDSFMGLVYFKNDYYGAHQIPGLLNNKGGSISNLYVGTEDAGVFERTVSRYGAHTYNSEEERYEFVFSQYYQFAPSGFTSDRASFNQKATLYHKSEAVAASTALKILANEASRVYSVRVYSKNLDRNEMNQNHLADLCGLYGSTFVSDILSSSPDVFAKIVEAVAELPLSKSLKGTSDFERDKSTFENTVSKVLEVYANIEEDSKPTVYDRLYVGAEGKKTENGGSLTALYSAYAGGMESLNLEAGLWLDKIAGNHATILGGALDATANPYGWTVREGGGFGYDMIIEDNGNNNTESMKELIKLGNSIVFDPSLLSSADFTVEYVASYENYTLVQNGVKKGDFIDHVIDDNGNKVTKKSHWADDPVPTDTIGILKNYATRAGYLEGKYRSVRWCIVPPAYDYSTGGVAFGFNSQLWGDSSRTTTNIYNQTILRDESALDGGVFEAVYSIYADGMKKVSGTYSTAAGDVKSAPVYYKDIEGQEFKLFWRAPVSVYAVRVYDTVLTEAEMKYNRFIDLAAYAGADLSVYEGLSAEKQMIIVDMMANSVYSTDSETFNKTLKQFENMLSKELGINEVLYATRGLTVLLSAYAGFHTASNQTSDTTVIWSNAVDQSTYGVLRGTGWEKNAQGGFTIVKHPDDYINTNSKEEYGLFLDGALLPTGSYTVELVANPVGITDEDGTRYIDTVSAYGTWAENGIAIGPLRAMQFACYRPAGYDGQMERRWNYGVGNTPFMDSGAKPLMQDTFWKGLGLKEIVTLEISMQVTESSHIYTVRQGEMSKGFTVLKENVISNEEAGGMFRMMNNVAGTIYSFRVYDHVLSAAEVAQNHMADLIYYYDIDVGLLASIIHSAGDGVLSLAEAFADFDFTMEKRTAQEIFSERITAMWLSAEGFAIKSDLTDGARYYFRLNEGAVSAALKAGMQLEIGTVVSVGKDAMPVLDGYGYDYKIVAFDTTMGKEKSLFIDEDSYAVTVRCSVADKSALIASIYVRGYVKLIDRDGNETVYYTYLDKKTPSSLFEAYYLMDNSGTSEYVSSERLTTFVAERIQKSYTSTYVYLDAAAPTGGNGSPEAPYQSFADAFERCKEYLRTVNVPTNVYLTAADGAYSILETQELLDADKPYLYSSLTVTSENGGAVLNTIVDTDASKFVFEGDNIYSYQFETDENGVYPSFRVLYVNDRRAAQATSGSTRSADTEDLFVTAFDRTYNQVYQTAKAMYGNMDFDFIPSSYEGRTDLSEEFAYYRDSYIALADVREIVKNNGLSALTYGMTPTRSGGSEAYENAFRHFTACYIAVKDAADLAGRMGIASQAFKDAAAPKDANAFGGNTDDFESYKQAFLDAKRYMTDNRVMTYDGFDVAERSDVRHIGKVYLPLDMVGDLTDLIDEGKMQMTLYIEKELLVVAEAVENARKAFDKATLAYADAKLSLDTLKTLEADFAVTLDALIADAEAKLAAADADGEHNASVILSALCTLRDSLGDDSEKALLAQMASYEEKLVALRNEIADAEVTYNEQIEKQAATEKRAAEIGDEDLWRRHALTPYKIEMHITCQWSYNIVHLTGVDYDDYAETVTENGVEQHVACYIDMSEYDQFSLPGGYSMAQRYVHMENAYAYLDENNEYFYDRMSGKLYLYSDTDVKDFDIGYGTLDYMFVLKDVENVTFRNVQFTGTDDHYLTDMGYTGGLCGMDNRYLSLYGLQGDFQDRSAIYAEDCTGFTVADCRFYDLPCEGISIRGWLEDAIFEGNTFERIGSAALRFGQHTRSVAYDGASWIEGVWGSRSVQVTDNYFTDIGYVYKVPVLQFTKLEDGIISQNTIVGCAYSGISVGWDWGINANYRADESVNARNVDISYNFITDFMTEMGDGAAIYMPIQNGTVGNTDFYMNNVHHNYVLFSKNTGDGMGKMVVGIYFDASTSNWYCAQNVVVEQSYGAHSLEADASESEEIARKQLRRQGSFYIYLQHIDAQETHNILVEGNMILNVRASDEEGMHREVYQNYFSVKDAVKGRNLIERDTVYVNGVGYIPDEAIEIIESAGAQGQKGDINLVYSNEY